MSKLQVPKEKYGTMKEKSGTLMKSSPSIFIGWQERQIILKDRKLKYFKPKNTMPSGVFNFDHYMCHVALSTKDQCVFTIKIEGVDRVFEFKAPDNSTSKEWVDAIEFHIRESEGI